MGPQQAASRQPASSSRPRSCTLHRASPHRREPHSRLLRNSPATLRPQAIRLLCLSWSSLSTLHWQCAATLSLTNRHMNSLPQIKTCADASRIHGPRGGALQAVRRNDCVLGRSGAPASDGDAITEHAGAIGSGSCPHAERRGDELRDVSAAAGYCNRARTLSKSSERTASIAASHRPSWHRPLIPAFSCASSAAVMHAFCTAWATRSRSAPVFAAELCFITAQIITS